MKTLARLCRRIDEGDLVDVCRALRLDADEAASVLSRHVTCPHLLRLVRQHGGTAADFARGRLEIRTMLRAVDADQARREIDWAEG
jgi:hypothetical protein